MKKSILAAGTALAIAAAIPLVALAQGGWHDGPGGRHGGMMSGGMHDGGHGGHHGKHGGKARMLDLIETYDADGDGKVTQAEIDTYRAARLKTFDADGDGKLSLAEYEKLWLDAMRDRMVDRFQSHDDDGDGMVTADEFGEAYRNMVILRDRDDDGALSLDDAEMRGPGGMGQGMGRGMGQGMMQKP